MNGNSAVLDSNILIYFSKGKLNLKADLITNNPSDFRRVDPKVKIIIPEIASYT